MICFLLCFDGSIDFRDSDRFLSSRASFSPAGVAKSPQLDVNGVHRSHGHCLLRGLQVIPPFLMEISDESALRADKMRVTVGVSVKSGPLSGQTDAQNDSLFFEESKCPVHGVEGNCRDSFADPGIDRLRVRMFICTRELTIDLRPLVSRLDPGTPADPREQLNSFPNFFRFEFHP